MTSHFMAHHRHSWKRRGLVISLLIMCLTTLAGGVLMTWVVPAERHPATSSTGAITPASGLQSEMPHFRLWRSRLLKDVPYPATSQGCVEYRATGMCSPEGLDLPHHAKSCESNVPWTAGSSGYCLCTKGRRIAQPTNCTSNDPSSNRRASVVHPRAVTCNEVCGIASGLFIPHGQLL